jgi:hypothetical protein
LGTTCSSPPLPLTPRHPSAPHPLLLLRPRSFHSPPDGSPHPFSHPANHLLHLPLRRLDLLRGGLRGNEEGREGGKEGGRKKGRDSVSAQEGS